MRKYNVILINLNSIPNLLFQPIFPIGAVYVSTYLKQIGVNVSFIDYKVSPELFETKDFLNKPFDCIAFSLRNIDSMELDGENYVSYYKEVMYDIVSKAKEINSQTLVLLGGGGYSVYHDGLQDILPFDQGIQGNVEEDLYNAVLNHAQSLGDDIEIIENFNLFDLDFDETLVNTYLNIGATEIGLPTRCGGRCPMKCVYCSYGQIDNKTNITRPLSSLKNDILSLYKIGVRNIFFTDSLFNISLSHAKSICKMIIELNLTDLQWSAYAKPTTDEEFIELCSLSRCKYLMVSFDTFAPKMLRDMKKGFNQTQAIKFIEICKKHKIDLMGLFLFGGPDENEETIKETCNIINKYFKRGEFFFSFGMRLLPGSVLAARSGIPDSEMVKPMFWPFDEQCFDYVVKHLNQEFFKLYNLSKITSWRKSFKKMELYKYPNSNYIILRKREDIVNIVGVN